MITSFFYGGVALLERREFFVYTTIAEKSIRSFILYFLFFFLSLTKSDEENLNLDDKLDQLLIDQYGKHVRKNGRRRI